MKESTMKSASSGKLLVKKCHQCGHVDQAYKELKKCKSCSKSFLPSNYFSKVHAKNTEEFNNLFCSSDELREEDLVKGLTVLW